jgi:hypothetical protein
MEQQFPGDPSPKRDVRGDGRGVAARHVQHVVLDVAPRLAAVPIGVAVIALLLVGSAHAEAGVGGRGVRGIRAAPAQAVLEVLTAGAAGGGYGRRELGLECRLLQQSGEWWSSQNSSLVKKGPVIWAVKKRPKGVVLVRQAQVLKVVLGGRCGWGLFGTNSFLTTP